MKDGSCGCSKVKCNLQLNGSDFCKSGLREDSKKGVVVQLQPLPASLPRALGLAIRCMHSEFSSAPTVPFSAS